LHLSPPETVTLSTERGDDRAVCNLDEECVIYITARFRQ